MEVTDCKVSGGIRKNPIVDLASALGITTKISLALPVLIFLITLSSQTWADDPDKSAWQVPKVPLPNVVLESEIYPIEIKIQSKVNIEWLKKQNTSADLVIGEQSFPMQFDGTQFTYNWKVTGFGTTKVHLKLHTRQGVLEGPDKVVYILPNTYLKLPEELNFNEVFSGCEPTEYCQELDLSKSKNLVEGLKILIFRQPAKNSDGWHKLEITLRQEDEEFLLTREAPAEITYSSEKPVTVCFAPPRCEKIPENSWEELFVIPESPKLNDGSRAAITILKGDIVPNSWLDCNLWWILIIVAVIVTCLIIYGYVAPNKFPYSAVLYVGNNEKAMRRDQGRPLYTAPGGRKGFYRTATCCFDDSGVTVRRRSGYTLMLKAESQGLITILGHAQVEAKERGKWKPLPPDQRDTLLDSGGVYRVNMSFYFRVDL